MRSRRACIFGRAIGFDPRVTVKRQIAATSARSANNSMVMRRQLLLGQRRCPDSAGNTGKGYEKSENPAAYHQATRMM